MKTNNNQLIHFSILITKTAIQIHILTTVIMTVITTVITLT